MKIALVTDTHFGARGDNLQFAAYFKKFYDEVFFPYLNLYVQFRALWPICVGLAPESIITFL